MLRAITVIGSSEFAVFPGRFVGSRILAQVVSQCKSQGRGGVDSWSSGEDLLAGCKVQHSRTVGASDVIRRGGTWIAYT